MNEKIKELWNEAAKMETDSSWEGQTRFMEKYAELIVQECIAKAEEEAERFLGFPNLEHRDMYAKVMYNYQELLRETFGVK
jgi:hypothetical protein